MGNITRVAAELGYTQSGISHIISRVEQEFHQIIFARSNEGIIVLPAAVPFLALMRQTVEAEDLLYKAARYDSSDTIRLSVLPTVATAWASQLLVDFSKNFPKFHFEIWEKKDYLDIVNDLKADTSDIGFINDISSQNLLFYPCYEDRYYVVFPREHALASLDEIGIEQIAQGPIILPEEAVQHKYLKNHLLKPDAPADPVFSSRKPIDDWMTLSMVEQGYGISVVPGLYLYRHRYSLHARPLKEGYSRVMGLCTRKEKKNSLEIRTFITFTRKWVKAWEKANPGFSC